MPPPGSAGTNQATAPTAAPSASAEQPARHARAQARGQVERAQQAGVEAGSARAAQRAEQQHGDERRGRGHGEVGHGSSARGPKASAATQIGDGRGEQRARRTPAGRSGTFSSSSTNSVPASDALNAPVRPAPAPTASSTRRSAGDSPSRAPRYSRDGRAHLHGGTLAAEHEPAADPEHPGDELHPARPRAATAAAARAPRLRPPGSRCPPPAARRSRSARARARRRPRSTPMTSAAPAGPNGSAHAVSPSRSASASSTAAWKATETAPDREPGERDREPDATFTWLPARSRSRP